MDKHWVRLTDYDGNPIAWLNMAAVAAVRQDDKGQLRIEMISDRESDPDKHPIVYQSQDVAAILAYLQQTTFEPTLAQEPDDTPAAKTHKAAQRLPFHPGAGAKGW